ncbi:MAG: phospholipase D-like domain-containing protein [Bacteroidetes bacterium]|nr:phospholipase D-like domain-containing protein [Bacteroidota bacterium]
MIRIQYIVPLLFLIFYTVVSQPATTVVISEVAPMGGSSSQYNTGEFIELYNPFAVDVTFGPNVKIVSGATPPGTNPAEWEVSLAGKTIKAYGFLLIGDGGVTQVTPDVYFPANKNLSNSGIRSCVQLRDGATILDAFAWDVSTTLSGEGTRFTPTNTTSDGKSFERKSSQAATGPDNLGNAWDSNNNSLDFFQNSASAKNPQNSNSPIEINPYNLTPATGKGNAILVPREWKFSDPTTLTLSISSQTDTVRAFQIIVPPFVLWNRNSVALQPSSAVLTISNDTLTVSNITIIGSDSVTVTFPLVTAMDTTVQAVFTIRTSSDGKSFYSLSWQPSILIYGSPRPMSWIKAKDASGTPIHNNKYVVVKGIVIVANEFGGPSYLEDKTAAIAVYDSSVSKYVNRGDEVILLGRVSPYYELFELTPCKILEKVSEGNTFDTLLLTIPDIKNQPQKGVEPYECKLVRISNIKAVLTTNNEPATTWSVTGSGTNYKVVSGTDTLEVRILARTNIANTSIPSGIFDIVGVLGQYYSTYQLHPRSLDDIVINSAGPRIISGVPYESKLGATSVTFRWITDLPSTSIVYYGTTTAYSSKIVDTTLVTVHEVTLSNLQPATVYNAKFGSSRGTDTTFTFNYLFSTTSAASTGVINVYFTKSVDHTVARGENAVSGTLYQRLINRINAAKNRIDAAFYSLSGTVGSAIASALVSAKQRGVQVRVIGEKDNSNTTAWSTLQTNGVAVLFDNVDGVNYGQGFMHNKFVVIDNGDDGDETNDWVWTGSWNATDPGDNNDAQNVIEIQDKAVARAFTMEFEEMWGSSTATPNSANARFGSHKTDNTPHFFNVKGVPIEVYFSPSDGTTAKIIKTINKARESVNFAILSFTRNDIANALTYKYRNGVKVRGIFDNRTDSGNEYDTLLARGLDVRLKANLTGYLHHKYAIIDANGEDSNKFVLTGSHNWSSSAEYSNDENTVIIQSPRIVNLFLQEFSQRYKDAGGTDVLVRTDSESIQPFEFYLAQNFPNPFNPTTTIDFLVPTTSHTTLAIYDVLGREIAQLVNEIKQPGSYRVVWDARNVASGVYFYKLVSGPFVITKRMVVLK